MSRKEGGRGLTIIKDSVHTSIRLEGYIQKRKRRLITATRKQKWKEKQLDGRFKRLISEISHKKTWIWLRKGNL